MELSNCQTIGNDQITAAKRKWPNKPKRMTKLKMNDPSKKTPQTTTQKHNRSDLAVGFRWVITHVQWPASQLPPDQGKQWHHRSVEEAFLSSAPALRECIGQAQGKRQKEHLDFPGSESDRDNSSASSTNGPKLLIIRVWCLFGPLQEILSDVWKP